MEDEKKRIVHPSSLIPHSSLTGVAAAVVLRPDGRFLLAQRPRGKPYAGYWEFPGGKLLPGETPLAALRRELQEELDLIIEDAYPWLVRDYVYPHASVRLHFFRVVRWRGNASGLEGQAVAWQRPGDTSVTPMLPANAPILRALTLPGVYAISNAYDIGVESFVKRVKNALERGIKMIQVREKQMPPSELHALASRIVKIAEPYGAKVLLNSDHMLNAEKIGVHGIHLTAERLMQCGQRPDFDLCGASCHNESELARAAELELDFVVLGPVRETPKQQTLLGWGRLSGLISSYPLPVYAIGGMQSDDLEQARRHGAHGVAMIRGAWGSEAGGQKIGD